ncbi:MAG: AAA family ATPase [Propionibacteriaceae bacterium]|jgi:hypothetical protein|nr:AAA family ATPase [Propionibacteriaceae bacterium]
MDPRDNPYSPGAGRRPVALIGREREMTAWDIALTRIADGRGAQSLVLYGLRGVGKTVLLTQLALMARSQGWYVMGAEARRGQSVREAIGESVHGLLLEIARPGVGQRILKAVKTALSFKASYDSTGVWHFGLDVTGAEGGGADTGALETDLGRLILDLTGAAEDKGAGVALLIDEAQDLATDELAALLAIVHGANQRGDRLLVALAGLPSLPRQLSEAKSYAERLFAFHEIAILNRAEAAAVLTEPAEALGVRWTTAALERVTAAAGGYPYFLQEYGQAAWNAADGSPIGDTDARIGIVQGRRALDAGFFRIRWERASPAERAYLRAMAQDGDGPSLTAQIATRLKKKPSALGPARANLIGKGLVYSPAHGDIAFTVPAMAAFIDVQP